MLQMPDAIVVIGALSTICVAIIKFAPVRNNDICSKDISLLKLDISRIEQSAAIALRKSEDVSTDALKVADSAARLVTRTAEDRILVLETQADSEKIARTTFETNITDRLDSLEQKIDTLIGRAH
jgi:hypothetical protein